MDLRQLRHFIAAAEEQHFSRAARRANVVQSALSTSIRSLEQELGVQLFVRTTRQVRLTEAGRVLLDKARVVLNAAREAREAVARVAGLEQGTLHLGATPSLPGFIDLPALLALFHERYPGIEVHLSQGNARQLLDRLTAAELDLAVLPLREPHAEIEIVPVARERMVLIAAQGHRLARNPRVSLADLAEESFVDFELGWTSRQLVDQAFASAGVQRRTVFEVSDLDTMTALVARGLGLALVPRKVVEPRRRSVVAIEIDGPEICWELVVACRKDGECSNNVPRAFMQLVAEQGNYGLA
jgi:DNA-binding transcriptional LysR family regulator